MLKFKDLTNGRHLPEFGNALFKKFKYSFEFIYLAHLTTPRIFKTLETTPSIVGSFLKDVNDGYIPNPYHNSIHGADVANSIAYFLTQEDFRRHFNDLEMSCMIISALVHDVGHPGFNNAFLVATKSTEALLCKNFDQKRISENFR